MISQGAHYESTYNVISFFKKILGLQSRSLEPFFSKKVRFYLKQDTIFSCFSSQILRHWIHRGIIDDPGKDFFVEDNEVIERAVLPLEYSGTIM